jgi:phospholipase/carboxylesterase
LDPADLGLQHLARAPRSGGSGPHPTLLLLHGRGADERDLLPLADELDPRLFVISVRAPLDLPPGYEWYRLLGIGVPEAGSFAGAFGALTHFVESLPNAYPIDPSRLIALGFSQGAVMAGSLLLARPELTRGTAMLSGYLPLEAGLSVDETKLDDRPVFVAHGLADPLIPIAAARLARDYFTRVGADLTYREYPIAHYIGPDELRDVAAWLQTRL